MGSHHLLTVTADQQLGGAELWVLVLLPYMIAGVALLIQWLNDEESGGSSGQPGPDAAAIEVRLAHPDRAEMISELSTARRA